MAESPSNAASAKSPEAVFAEEFVRICRQQLRERLRRIEVCLEKLTSEQIWSRHHETENAVGNLILHLAGNVQQWIISGVGGVPDQRDRDAEFARREPLSPPHLLGKLTETIEEAETVLARLSSSDLLSKRKIQAYEVTVLHAVFHVVEHFAEHTGQIIWATKRMSGEDLGFYRYLEKRGHEPGSGTPRP